jgi:hypothetical protein
MLLQQRANPNLQNRYKLYSICPNSYSLGESSLALAVRKGYSKIVVALLDHWADYTNITPHISKLTTSPAVSKVISGSYNYPYPSDTSKESWIRRTKANLHLPYYLGTY